MTCISWNKAIHYILERVWYIFCCLQANQITDTMSRHALTLSDINILKDRGFAVVRSSPGKPIRCLQLMEKINRPFRNKWMRRRTSSLPLPLCQTLRSVTPLAPSTILSQVHALMSLQPTSVTQSSCSICISLPGIRILNMPTRRFLDKNLSNIPCFEWVHFLDIKRNCKLPTTAYVYLTRTTSKQHSSNSPTPNKRVWDKNKEHSTIRTDQIN
jgi:hypothetical protein